MPVFADPGTGWHLLTGRLILSGGLPIFDSYLSPPASIPWVNEQWLGDLLLGVVESVMGLPGVFILVIGICALSFLVILRRLIEQRTTSLSVSVIIFLLACLTASVQFICRPLVFSLLFLVILHSVLLSDLQPVKLSRTRYLIWIPLTFAVWANIHGAFTLGLLLLGLFFAHRLISSKGDMERFGSCLAFSAITVILAAAATLINPWGIELWKNVLGLASSQYFMSLNTEWLPLDFFNAIFIAPLLLIAALAFSPRPAGCFKRYFYEFSASAVIILLLLIHRRYIVFLPIVIAPLIAGLLQGGSTDEIRKRKSTWGRILRADQSLSARYPVSAGGSLVTAVAFLVISLASLLGFSDAAHRFPVSYPMRIADYLSAKQSTTESDSIFATPDFGGFLVYHLWPRYRVYLDDRNQLIGEERYKAYFRILGISQGWQEALKSTGGRYAILGADAPLSKLLERRPELGWEIEFKDEVSKNILFRRNAPP